MSYEVNILVSYEMRKFHLWHTPTHTHTHTHTHTQCVHNVYIGCTVCLTTWSCTQVTIQYE